MQMALMALTWNKTLEVLKTLETFKENYKPSKLSSGYSDKESWLLDKF